MRPTHLLGSEWLDQHGNRFRVYSTSRQDDGGVELGLAYVPPENKRMTLVELEERHCPCKDGTPFPGSPPLPSSDVPKGTA